MEETFLFIYFISLRLFLLLFRCRRLVLFCFQNYLYVTGDEWRGQVRVLRWGRAGGWVGGTLVGGGSFVEVEAVGTGNVKDSLKPEYGKSDKYRVESEVKIFRKRL